MITTTLNRIRERQPCTNGWQTLLAYLGKTKADDEPLPYAVILKSNGLDDALWCCRAEPQYEKEWRLYAVWCARQVQHLMTDPRSIAALDVAERFANGGATQTEMEAARDAAGDAAAGGAMWAAKWTAARTAAMWAAARGAACDAAWDAARTAACDAACAARTAAGSAEWAAARDAACAAARDAQSVRFLEVVGDAIIDNAMKEQGA